MTEPLDGSIRHHLMQVGGQTIEQLVAWAREVLGVDEWRVRDSVQRLSLMRLARLSLVDNCWVAVQP